MKIIFKVPVQNNNILNINEYKSDRVRDIRLIVKEALIYVKKDLDYYDLYYMDIIIENEEEEKGIEEIKNFVKNIYKELVNEKKLAHVDLFVTRKVR